MSRELPGKSHFPISRPRRKSRKLLQGTHFPISRPRRKSRKLPWKRHNPPSICPAGRKSSLSVSTASGGERGFPLLPEELRKREKREILFLLKKVPEHRKDTVKLFLQKSPLQLYPERSLLQMKHKASAMRSLSFASATSGLWSMAPLSLRKYGKDVLKLPASEEKRMIITGQVLKISLLMRYSGLSGGDGRHSADSGKSSFLSARVTAPGRFFFRCPPLKDRQMKQQIKSTQDENDKEKDR